MQSERERKKYFNEACLYENENKTKLSHITKCIFSLNTARIHGRLKKRWRIPLKLFICLNRLMKRFFLPSLSLSFSFSFFSHKFHLKIFFSRKIWIQFFFLIRRRLEHIFTYHVDICSLFLRGKTVFRENGQLFRIVSKIFFRLGIFP